MARKAKSLTVAGLRAAIAGASPTGAGPGTDRARRLLLAWFDTAAGRGAEAKPLARALRDGIAARQIAQALQPESSPAPLACQAGCAFCCILDGPDGGTITAEEAQRLHAALAPLAGQPDGRAWHPNACPALDPATQSCRAYDARPQLCRAYVSTDASACETNAAGGSAAGAGLMGFHLDYLEILALTRSALTGIAPVQTYALSRVAAGAVDGQDRDASLNAARHRPKMLEDARRGLTSVAAARG